MLKAAEPRARDFVEVFGNWASTQQRHFADGCVFDVSRAQTRGGAPPTSHPAGRWTGGVARPRA